VEVTINNINTQIAFQYTATEASCNGNDGSLTITSISGGVANYEISFQGGYLSHLVVLNYIGILTEALNQF
jgi:hypothetical protein